MHYNSEKLILFRGFEVNFEGLIKDWKTKIVHISVKNSSNKNKLIPYLCTIPLKQKDLNNSIFISISSGKNTTKINKRQNK